MIKRADLSETWTCRLETGPSLDQKNRSYRAYRTYQTSGDRRGSLAAAVARARSFGFAILFAQHRLPRQLDLVPFAADALHHDLLPFLQLVTNVLNTTIRDLRDVQQSVRARKDLHERAEIDDPVDRAEIRLAHFSLRR